MARQNDLAIREITRETEDTVSISFDVPKELIEDYKFIPGQYLTLRAKIDGQDVRRSYSICTSPSENDLRVAVKQVENGLFSTYSNKVLEVGDILTVMKPNGRFTINISPEKITNYLLVAAGSGITPILSIAKGVLEAEPDSTITLIYGNKTFDSIIFKEQIEGLKNTYMARFNVIHILSRESLGSELNSGRIDVAKFELLSKTVIDISSLNQTYLCGPAQMITSVSDWLKANGMKEENIHFELFTSPNAVKNVTEKVNKDTIPNLNTSKITVIIDGDELEFEMPLGETKNILDVANDKGGDLPFACKGGVCCTCRAKLLEGEVEMKLNYSLETHEVEKGFILTCQSIPKSKKLVIDFDEV